MTLPSQQTARVMTWNIHGGVGRDRVCDLARTISLVLSHRPDIVALQEVDSRRKAPTAAGAFAYLADALGRHVAVAKLITAPGGDYGHAVFSRWPISRYQLHDITLPGREPRAAIEATVETPRGALHLIAAHLGLSIRERQGQAAQLLSLANQGPKRTVILGDFNDWVWSGSVQKSLAQAMPERTHHKTFPARLPLFALDRIYARPAGLLAKSWTDENASVASDHLPVVADLNLST